MSQTVTSMPLSSNLKVTTSVLWICKTPDQPQEITTWVVERKRLPSTQDVVERHLLEIVVRVARSRETSLHITGMEYLRRRGRRKYRPLLMSEASPDDLAQIAKMMDAALEDHNRTHIVRHVPSLALPIVKTTTIMPLPIRGYSCSLMDLPNELLFEIIDEVILDSIANWKKWTSRKCEPGRRYHTEDEQTLPICDKVRFSRTLSAINLLNVNR